MGAKPQILACYALALALLLFRLAQTGQGPLIADEPRLLNQVDLAQETGAWPRTGLMGNVGVRYGPVAHYFYRGVQALSHSAEAPLVAHALAFLLAQLLLALAVHLAHGASSAALFLLLAASSPWLYQYSLMPWDNLLLFPFSAGAALAVTLAGRARTTRQHLGAGAALGLALALALGTHLMAGCLAFAAAAALALTFRERKREGLLLSACALAVLLLLLAPYLLALHPADLGSSNPRQVNPLRAFAGLFTFLSPGGMEYFLVPQEGLFFESTKPLGKTLALDPVGWGAKLFVCLTLGSLVLRFMKAKSVSPLLVLGSLALFACFAQLLLTGIRVHPHYFAPVWWAPFALLAASELRFKTPVAATLAATNVAFVLLYAGFLRQQGGTRGDYYGTSFAEQRSFVRSLCLGGESPRVVDLSASTLRPDSLIYFYRRLPECGSLTAPVRFTQGGPAHLRPGFADQPPGGARLVRLPVSGETN